MARKVVPRKPARQDVQEAIHFYRRRQDSDEVRGFRRQLKETFRHIAANPALGDPHFARELNLPGLRYRRLETYPFLVFYVERPEYIEVWRVLHQHRDIPASLLEVR